MRLKLGTTLQIIFGSNMMNSITSTSYSPWSHLYFPELWSSTIVDLFRTVKKSTNLVSGVCLASLTNDFGEIQFNHYFNPSINVFRVITLCILLFFW